MLKISRQVGFSQMASKENGIRKLAVLEFPPLFTTNQDSPLLLEL